MPTSFSTLHARPGLVAEMEEHLRGSDKDLRRAAEGVLSVLDVPAEMSAALADPDLDRWEKLAACEAVAGERTEALLRAAAGDRRSDGTVRAAAQDLLEALRIRARGAQAAGSEPDPDRSRDASTADGAVADRSRDASAAAKPAPEPDRKRRRLFFRRR